MGAYAFLHFYISTAVESVEMWKSGEALDRLPRLVHHIDESLCVSTVVDRCRNAEMLVNVVNNDLSTRFLILGRCERPWEICCVWKTFPLLLPGFGIV